MNILLEKLKAYFGKSFSEGGLFDEIKALVEEKVQAAKDAAEAAFKATITELKTKVENFETEIAKLKPLADHGKAYVDDLVKRYVDAKVRLEELATDETAKTATKTMAAAFPIDFLRTEVTHLENRVAEKFPDTSQLAGKEDPEKKAKPSEKKKSLRPDK